MEPASISQRKKQKPISHALAMNCLSCVLLSSDRELKLSLACARLIPTESTTAGNTAGERYQSQLLTDRSTQLLEGSGRVVSVAGVRWSTLVKRLFRSLSAICTVGCCAKHFALIRRVR